MLRSASGGVRGPQLVFRVGVVGHRRERLRELQLQEVALRTAVHGALAQIKETIERVRDQAGKHYAGQAELRLISALAEGADRIGAEESQDLGYKLQCILPFHRGVYVDDFPTLESQRQFSGLLQRASGAVLELDGDPEDRPAAYWEAGKVLVRHSDLVIAIWDGNTARGEGGTAQIAEEALRIGLPVLRIDARFPYPQKLLMPGMDCHPPLEKDAVQPALYNHCKNALLLSAAPEPKRTLRFLNERVPRVNYGLFFHGFVGLWTGDWSKARRLWLFSSGSSQPNLFKRADRLAESYSGRYRSSFVMTYLLGAGAVLAAFLGVRSPKQDWFFVELLLIALIFFLTLRGRLGKWHECWIDYRHLAEALRQKRLLAFVGLVPLAPSIPVHFATGDQENSWSDWYFRALVRATGVPRMHIGPQRLKRFRGLLQGRINHQTRYHHRNCRLFEQLHQGLFIVTQILFLGAAAACLLHVLLHVIHPLQPRSIELLLGACALVFPAFGAALGAISHHGEFERVSRRSHALAQQLNDLCTLLQSAPIEIGCLRQVAERFSGVMLAELTDWRYVFLDKNLELPA